MTSVCVLGGQHVYISVYTAVHSLTNSSYPPRVLSPNLPHLRLRVSNHSVRLLNCPSLVHVAPAKSYPGHSAHVMNVRFLPNDERVVSVGGSDGAVFQWRVAMDVDAAAGAGTLGAGGRPVAGSTRQQQPRLAWKAGW